MINLAGLQRAVVMLAIAALACTLQVAHAQDAETKASADDESEKPEAKDSRDEVLDLLKAGELKAAAARLEEAIADEPDRADLQQLRQTLSAQFSSKRDYASALEQSQAWFAFLARKTDTPATAASLATSVQQIYAYAARSGKPEAAVEAADQTIAIIEPMVEANPQLWMPLARLVMVKSTVLSNAGDRDAASAVTSALQQRLADVDASDQANEETAQAFAYLLTAAASRETDTEQRAARRQELDAYTIQALEKYPESAAIQTLYAGTQYSQVAATYRDDPEGAQARIDATFAKLGDAAEENPGLKSTLTRLKSYESRIEAALKVARMIGNPAPPLQIAGWANTENFSEDSLAGKVVLYDFWAVWCGPCIATFPHLREWQAEFGDEGFQVVGITRYYKYQWDAEAEKAVRSKEDVDPEIEHEAVAKFLQSHDLQHPTIFVPAESTLQSEYGVTGIPHAVLIDRQGRVRMVKVGSGTANAEALHAMIKELIAE